MKHVSDWSKFLTDKLPPFGSNPAVDRTVKSKGVVIGFTRIEALLLETVLPFVGAVHSIVLVPL